MKTVCLFVLLLFVCSSQANFLDDLADWFMEQLGIEMEPPLWNGLTAGFGRNLSSPAVFATLPRTVEEAVAGNWMKDDSVSCGSGSAYEGNRYIGKDRDPGVMLLFDKNGYIAGIQGGVPKVSDPSAYPNPVQKVYDVFNEENDLMVLTAYFVEPTTICSDGRSERAFEREGTGNMLAVQMGSNSNNLIRLPMDEKDIGTTKFALGRCTRMMGTHYWYQYDEDVPLEDQSCDKILPVFALYDKGKLNAFGWAFNVGIYNSWRWEYKPVAILDYTMIKRFKCLGDGSGVTSGLHIYFYDDPKGIVCESE